MCFEDTITYRQECRCPRCYYNKPGERGCPSSKSSLRPTSLSLPYLCLSSPLSLPPYLCLSPSPLLCDLLTCPEFTCARFRFLLPSPPPSLPLPVFLPYLCLSHCLSSPPQSPSISLSSLSPYLFLSLLISPPSSTLSLSLSLSAGKKAKTYEQSGGGEGGQYR